MKVSLTPDNTILKTILTPGHGPNPLKEQEVTLHYTLMLPNEKILDSSVTRDSPLRFTLGSQQVTAAVELAASSMQRGEKSRFEIYAQYVHNWEGIPKGNDQVVLEAELIDFVTKKKPLPEMTFEEKVKAAEEFKVKGNDFFKAKLLKEASDSYKEGITFLDSVLEEEKQSVISTLWNSLHLNLCVCLNSLGLWSESKKNSDKVLERTSKNPKARYLRGIAEKNMSQFDEALEDFKQALSKNPNDERIKYEIENTKERKKQLELKTKKALGKFFKTESLYSEKEPLTLKVPPYDPHNPKVYMDIQIGQDPGLKRIIIELFAKTVPKTVENFKCLCTGEKSTGVQKFYYKGCKFYKLVKGFMIEGGDIEKNDGTGGQSIYNGKFTSENAWIEHSTPGLLSMSSSGPNGNDSKFFILFGPAQWLNKKHTVFGRIIKGLDTLKLLEAIPVNEKDVPKEPVTITDCGIFEGEIEAVETN